MNSSTTKNTLTSFIVTEQIYVCQKSIFLTRLNFIEKDFEVIIGR